MRATLCKTLNGGGGGSGGPLISRHVLLVCAGAHAVFYEAFGLNAHNFQCSLNIGNPYRSGGALPVAPPVALPTGSNPVSSWLRCCSNDSPKSPFNGWQILAGNPTASTGAAAAQPGPGVLRPLRHCMVVHVCCACNGVSPMLRAAPLCFESVVGGCQGADNPVEACFSYNPYPAGNPAGPPSSVRVTLYAFTPTDPKERAATGRWWKEHKVSKRTGRSLSV